MVRSLLQDESGFILSGEFLIIMTIAFCGVIVGFVTSWIVTGRVVRSIVVVSRRY